MGPSSIDQVSILASTLRMALVLILGSSIHHSTFSAVSSFPCSMIFLLYSGTSVLIIYISDIKKYSAVMYYWNADYFKTSVSWGLMLNCFCLESCFLCLISMISDRLTTHYWNSSGVRFMRAPTKPRGVGKIDRQELEAGTSPSCGSPGVRLFWSFGW